MKKRIKIIDLLCLISVGEEVPQTIKVGNLKLYWDGVNYWDEDGINNLGDIFSIRNLNDEAEILDDEEDKDIPFIPDDELYSVFDSKEGINKNKRIDYNFKVLQEKINQVVKEFNEYRKGE